MVDIKKAAETGEKQALLLAIRDKLAESLDHTESGRDIAALTKRLMQVADEIETNKRQLGTTKHDRLMKRSEERIYGKQADTGEGN